MGIMEREMISVLDLPAQLDKLTVFARTATSPEAERKKGIAQLAPYRDGAIFASKFSGTGGWERHPNGDELVYVVEGATMLCLMGQHRLQAHPLRAGMVAIIPQGLWHRFESPSGVTLMAATPQPTEHPETDVDDPRLLSERRPAT
jgi:mannose-6-phosphate isomerase-like protein (cupin superfamily)